MSHVAEVTLEVRDLDALAAACKELGLELVRGQTKYRWYGRVVGGYPLPVGFTANDLGKCDHAIRIPNNDRAYEIGIVRSRTGNGFQLLWDFWQGGYGMAEKVGGNDANRLKQIYAKHVAMRTWQKKGFRVTTSTKADGTVLVHASR